MYPQGQQSSDWRDNVGDVPSRRSNDDLLTDDDDDDFLPNMNMNGGRGGGDVGFPLSGGGAPPASLQSFMRMNDPSGPPPEANGGHHNRSASAQVPINSSSAAQGSAAARRAVRGQRRTYGNEHESPFRRLTTASNEMIPSNISGVVASSPPREPLLFATSSRSPPRTPPPAAATIPHVASVPSGTSSSQMSHNEKPYETYRYYDDSNNNKTQQQTLPQLKSDSSTHSDSNHMIQLPNAPYQEMLQTFGNVGVNSSSNGAGGIGGMLKDEDSQAAEERQAAEMVRMAQSMPPGAPTPAGDPKKSSERPLPKPGLPMPPTATAIEPALPPSRLGRRCLTNKPTRGNDIQEGQTITTMPHQIPRDQYLVDCAACGGTLQIQKQTIVVHCSRCDKCIPVATCPIRRPGA